MFAVCILIHKTIVYINFEFLEQANYFMLSLVKKLLGLGEAKLDFANS